ncbi:carbohydrate ABC transporter permease [Mycetocola zhadangensis]|uniref:Sugar ABC transporter permease n=1 Tax=Mycetocola zhadangensis TaxID=1164595 RepID=A0A3L7IX41_9MICO|nr:sugar ABC transporter permease [Mycetocola zhadangensis]RLQ82713.1 sugar ABC transporter permease [Mycetocola zhadangensis]GGE98823.1 ABC transporter permease [Mycetocola zhadangensis]
MATLTDVKRPPRQTERATKKRPRTSGKDLNGAARFRPAWMPLLWLLAPIGVVAAFYLYPFLNIIFLSFTDASPLSGNGDFVGLENYQFLANDPVFWNAVLNSVVYAICVVPLMVALPLLLAVLLKDHIPGIGFFRSLFYIPAISSLVVVSLAWTAILKDNGTLNTTLMDLQLISEPLPFLTGRWFLLFSAMAVTLWQGLPYYMVLYLAALSNVDRSLYEAAAVDGAGPIRRFFTVTVPGVRIMMSLVGILTMIGSIKIFTEVHLLSNGSGGIGGESQTLTMYIRSVGLDPTYGSLGQGAAGSVFLFLLTLGLLLMSQRLNRKAEEQ